MRFGMDKKSAKDLLEKYRTGRCTVEERAIVENWYAELGEGVFPGEKVTLDTKQRVWSSVSSLLTPERPPVWKQLAAASIALLLLLGGIYTYRSYFLENERLVEKNIADEDKIAPGGRVAVLTLSDGSKISLDDAGQGNLAVQGRANIVKLENGQIAYSENGKSEDVGLNVLQTPRGGQYAVTLADGTRVWLNAESSITYPTVFNGTERRVEITGEVYFEVSHREEQPFFVVSKHQELRVLGTHFNVEAYEDEGETKTTLLEGSVQVASVAAATHPASKNRGSILKPKQQAVIWAGDKSVEISDVNPEDIVAWKNGLFVFNSESMESVMRKIARWYDVKVVYKDDEAKKEFFGGSMSRFDHVSTVLEMLEKTGDVRFQVEGKTIVVYAGK